MEFALSLFHSSNVFHASKFPLASQLRMKLGVPATCSRRGVFMAKSIGSSDAAPARRNFSWTVYAMGYTSGRWIFQTECWPNAKRLSRHAAQANLGFVWRSTARLLGATRQDGTALSAAGVCVAPAMWSESEAGATSPRGVPLIPRANSCACQTICKPARELFHGVGNACSQLHYRLAHFTVFRNVALNTTKIGL
jgi:hypothetical protein